MAVQKCLSRLEENLLKFCKGQCRVLPLGNDNSRHQHSLGLTCSAEKDLVDTELPLGQQCPGGQEGQWEAVGNALPAG